MRTRAASRSARLRRTQLSGVAILVTVFCCLPTGIAAIIYAAQVNTKLQAGDIAGAQLSSKNAKMWVLISVGAGLLVMLCYFGFLFLTLMGHHRF
jgi:hypothetical protein